LDTNKELVGRVFGELMIAKPEVTGRFIRLRLHEIAVRIQERQAHNSFVRFVN
jgi:hypothetical protein